MYKATAIFSKLNPLYFIAILVIGSSSVTAQNLNADLFYDRDFIGRFQHFDENGVLLFEDNNVNGKFDFEYNYGFIEGEDRFERRHWWGDTLLMIPWMGVSGSGESSSHIFSWKEDLYLTKRGLRFCTNVVNMYDECENRPKDRWVYIYSERYQYEFELSEGTFAGVLLLDAFGEQDIPVISAMRIEDIDEDLTITVSSIDTDQDGVPGTAMLSGPYAGQTFSYNGRQFIASVNEVQYVRRVEFQDGGGNRVIEEFTVGKPLLIDRLRNGAGIYQRNRFYEVSVGAPGFLNKHALVSDKTREKASKRARQYVEKLIRRKISNGFALVTDSAYE